MQDNKPFKELGKQQPQELQTAFLDGILNQSVAVYLVNGIKLTGKVRHFDPFTLQLQGTDSVDSLLFKHAISTFIPGAPVMTRERRTPFEEKARADRITAGCLSCKRGQSGELPPALVKKEPATKRKGLAPQRREIYGGVLC